MISEIGNRLYRSLLEEQCLGCFKTYSSLEETYLKSAIMVLHM